MGGPQYGAGTRVRRRRAVLAAPVGPARPAPRQLRWPVLLAKGGDAAAGDGERPGSRFPPLARARARGGDGRCDHPRPDPDQRTPTAADHPRIQIEPSATDASLTATPARKPSRTLLAPNKHMPELSTGKSPDRPLQVSLRQTRRLAAATHPARQCHALHRDPPRQRATAAPSTRSSTTSSATCATSPAPTFPPAVYPAGARRRSHQR